jgi:predicted RNase H-like HicB family nuclease
MKSPIVYEKSATGSGTAPDLPGLGAAGKALDEVKDLIREEVEFHLEGVREHGDPIPALSAMTGYITIDVGLAGCGKRRWQVGRTKASRAPRYNRNGVSYA